MSRSGCFSEEALSWAENPEWAERESMTPAQRREAARIRRIIKERG